MTEEAVKFIKQYCKKEVAELTEETAMSAELGIDSLTFVRMVNDAEDVFDVTIRDEFLPKVRTVGDFLKLIEKVQN